MLLGFFIPHLLVLNSVVVILLGYVLIYDSVARTPRWILPVISAVTRGSLRTSAKVETMHPRHRRLAPVVLRRQTNHDSVSQRDCAAYARTYKASRKVGQIGASSMSRVACAGARRLGDLSAAPYLFRRHPEQPVIEEVNFVLITS